MKNVASIIASVLVFGLAGCSLYSAQDEGPADTEQGDTEPSETSSGGSKSSSSGNGGKVVKGEPTTSIAYKGPFVIGDGTSEKKGDAECQSSLGVKTAPSTNALEFPFELQGTVTAVTVKVSKLCGGDILNTAFILLQKDGVTVEKKELDFGDSDDVVRDNSISFEAEDDTGYEAGSYAIVFSADTNGPAEQSGAWNDVAAGGIDVGVIGSGKLVKVGEPDVAPPSMVHWDDTFSVGDNIFTGTDRAAEDEACRSGLGAGPATSTTRRFQVEIDGDVTDLAFGIEKTCGGEILWQPELRIYEGDSLLIVKREGGYSEQDQVISTIVHANNASAGRPIKPGVYTLEFAGHDTNDASASGINAWVVGKNATIKKL